MDFSVNLLIIESARECVGFFRDSFPPTKGQINPDLSLVLKSQLTADESLHTHGFRQSGAVDCARRHGNVVDCKAVQTIQFNLP